MADDERISRKAAPRRTILEIIKSGSWGRVEYRHRLECGHTEVRKRASSAPVISCTWCVVAERTDGELRKMVQTPHKNKCYKSSRIASGFSGLLGGA